MLHPIIIYKYILFPNMIIDVVLVYYSLKVNEAFSSEE